MMFDKQPDGRMKVRHGGGTSRKRMHSAGDMTGAEIMRVLRDEARNRTDKIKIMEFSPAVEVLLDEKGRASGAILYNLETKEYYKIKAKSVLIATGGNGRLHIQNFPTTNHYEATASAINIAYTDTTAPKEPKSTQCPPTGLSPPSHHTALIQTDTLPA